MLQYLSKFLYILQGKHQKLLMLAVLFIVVSALEVIGIGLIGPFIQIATAPTISEIPWASLIYNRFELTSRSQFLFIFGSFIISTLR